MLCGVTQVAIGDRDPLADFGESDREIGDDLCLVLIRAGRHD